MASKKSVTRAAPARLVKAGLSSASALAESDAAATLWLAKGELARAALECKRGLSRARRRAGTEPLLVARLWLTLGSTLEHADRTTDAVSAYAQAARTLGHRRRTDDRETTA